MRSLQRFESSASLLLWNALVVASLFWLWSDYQQASAEDLQAVISMATPSPEATSLLAVALKETPRPDHAQLRDMRKRVNEALVAESMRSLTGDQTLESPSVRAAAGVKKEWDRFREAWAEASNEKRIEFVASHWGILLFVLVVAFIGWRVVSRLAHDR